MPAASGIRFRSGLRRNGRPLCTTQDRAEAMARVRRAGTAPELAVRRALSQLGLRYTTSNRDLAGSPDLANRTRRFAVFVNGCFWHRHVGCTRCTTPKRNRAFWLDKFAANVRRDRRVVRALRREGYRVVIVWECRVAEFGTMVKRLGSLLSSPRPPPTQSRRS